MFPSQLRDKEQPGAANLPTKTLDFRGFDFIIISISRGGVLMSIGDSPEILSQRILVGITLVGRLGVWVCLTRSARCSPVALECPRADIDQQSNNQITHLTQWVNCKHQIYTQQLYKQSIKQQDICQQSASKCASLASLPLPRLHMPTPDRRPEADNPRSSDFHSRRFKVLFIARMYASFENWQLCLGASCLCSWAYMILY